MNLLQPMLRTLCLAVILATPVTGVRPATGVGPAGPSSRQLAQEGKRQLDAGDLPAAMTSFSAARERLDRESPVDAELADFLGLQLYNLGVRFNNAADAPRAMACFTEALRAGGPAARIRDAAFRESLGRAALDVAAFLVATGKPDLTLSAYALLPKVLPRDARVQTGLGAAQLARGDHRAALTAYRQAELELREEPVVVLGLGRALLGLARETSSGDHQQMLEQAADMLGRPCLVDSSSAAMQRELASSLILLGRTAGRLGDVGLSTKSALSARQALERAVTLDPQSVWARIDLANLLLRSRRYAESLPLLTDAVEQLDEMMARSPSDPNAAAWRDARASCGQNRAIASFNLAVDAVNRGEFDQIERHLQGVCELPGSWQDNCRSLRQTAARRESSLRELVESQERTLAAQPGSATALLALGDLYAGLGRYDKALAYYGRLDKANRSSEIEERIADVAHPGTLVERRRPVDIPSSRVEIRYYRETLSPEFDTALKAAWLRVTAALGTESIRGPLLVTLYPNRRAFREQAGYRVGGMVKGNYSPGQVSLFARPGQTTVEWVSVLTHEITHHAVEKLSGGAAPRWLSEGVARWVEGDSTVIDRERVSGRLRQNAIRSLRSMDETMDRFWNDPAEIMDGRDVALLAVEEISRRAGGSGIRQILSFLATSGPEIDTALRKVTGTDLDAIDSAWRAALLGGR